MEPHAFETPPLPLPPKAPAAPAPVRRANSIRRTSSIDVWWPEGRGGAMQLVGRARDLVTGPDGVLVRDEDALRATVDMERTIHTIDAEPPRPAIKELVGQRGGGRLRAALEAALPLEVAGATPLNLLVDDISGSSLIAGWAWSQWDPNWGAELLRMKADPAHAQMFNRVDICSGLRAGSSGLDLIAEGAPTASLRHPDDPDGWHAMPDIEGASMRRARRIDVSLDGQTIRIEAAFQDSATTPAGPRAALHEYRIFAEADLEFRLTALRAEPRVLPFAECPAAAGNAGRLIGTPLQALRTAVPIELKGTVGCTHLNDALRGLADVPTLVARLRAAMAERRATAGAHNL